MCFFYYNPVSYILAVKFSQALNRQVIALSGARSKHNLLTITLYQVGDLLAGLLCGLLSLPAELAESNDNWYWVLE